MCEIVIRKLGSRDVDEFIRLRLEGLEHDPVSFGCDVEVEKARPRSYLVEHLAPTRKRVLWGAFRGERLVGLIRLAREGRASQRFIYALYVSAQERRRGLARRLLRTAILEAKRAPSVKQVWLTVETTSAGALALYRAMGFRECGIEKDAFCVEGKSYSEFLMRKFVRSRQSNGKQRDPLRLRRR